MMKTLKVALLAATAFSISVTPSSASEDVVVVYDASGSMWGQIDGVSKIEIAREVMADLVKGWSDDTNLGLVAYGHRQQADCSDIETMIEPGPLDRDRFVNIVNAITPVGKTPISAAVQHAADLMSYRDNPATVILISDGLETCQADPCALSAQLARQGVNFTTHVIGFDLKDDAHASLACIAENTGGVFVPAQNAAELKQALAHVQSVMDLQPIAQENPEAPTEAEIVIEAPATVTAGASFNVNWSQIIHPQDRITIVAAGAKEGSQGAYIDTDSSRSGKLVAPENPGLYEVRYLRKEGRRTLGSVPFEVVESEVTISGPNVVRAGSVLRATWSQTINPQDRIAIVSAGAKEGSSGSYTDAGEKTTSDIKAPKAVGLYELRYILKQGRRTLASHIFEVVDADAPLDDGAGLKAPKQAKSGATITVLWSGGSDSDDQRITLARSEQADFSWISVHKAGVEKTLEIKMPKDAGTYEIRFLDISERKVLGRTIVEVK